MVGYDREMSQTWNHLSQVFQYSYDGVLSVQRLTVWVRRKLTAY